MSMNTQVDYKQSTMRRHTETAYEVDVCMTTSSTSSEKKTYNQESARCKSAMFDLLFISNGDTNSSTRLNF